MKFKAVVVAMLTAAALPVFGQTGATTGSLTVLVRDAQKAVLVGAEVTVTRDADGTTRTVLSNEVGQSVFDLPPGDYSVRVMASGFAAPTTAERVDIAVGERRRLEFTFRDVVAPGETVEVRAPFADPARAVIAANVAREEIDRLPNNIRDPMSFAFLSPGVATDRTPSQGSSATSGLTFAGQRARSNNVLADGMDNNDSTVGGVRSVLPQEAVEEFQVLTSGYSAEFGKASGGVVSIVTRQGANVNTGSAFVLFRDDTLSAKDYFERFNPAGQSIDRAKAPYGQQQFGASAGGPLRRNRLFYFTAFEGLRIQANNFVTIDDTTAVTLFGQTIGTAADILRRAGFPVETGNVPYAVRSNKLFGRIDAGTGADRVNVRGNWATDYNENSEPWGGEVARSRGAVLEAKDLTTAATYARTGRRTLNDVRTQIVYRDQNVLPLDPTCTGACDRDDEGGPTLEVAGVASVGRQRFSPQPRTTLRYEAADLFSLPHRRGSLKVGADYNAIDHRSGSLPLHFGGRYVFGALPAIPGVLPAPVSAIQALALGLPRAYVQGYGNPQSRYLVQDLSAFAQDDWRFASVTVNAGVRFQTQVWPDIGYTVKGLDPYTFPANRNVAPRLAVAWTPWSTTSVHGGFGRFYDNHLTSLPGVTDIVDGSASGVRTLVMPFPASVAAWNAPGHRLPESAVGPYPSLAITVAPNLRTPYSDQATVGVTREVGRSLELSADYIHVRGHDQVGTLDYNPLVPALGPNRRPDDVVINGVAIPGSSASVLQYTSYGLTWYDGVAMTVRQRLSRGVQWRASYTLSRAEDNATDYQNAFLPQDTGRGRNPADPTGLPIGFDPLADRSRSLQDQRHRFVGSGLCLLPGRVEFAAIVTVASGRPYNILAGEDLNGDGNGGAFPPDRARRVPGDPSTSVGRNAGTLPAWATTDVRVSRAWTATEGLRLEATLEAFNLFNRTNFIDVNNVFGSGAYPTQPLPTYGQFDIAAAPRQVQLGLSLRW